MLVFIDESGDSGLKLDSGSSEQFVVSLVIFHDYDEADKVDRIIEALKRDTCRSPFFEFKFNYKLTPQTAARAPPYQLA